MYTRGEPSLIRDRLDTTTAVPPKEKEHQQQAAGLLPSKPARELERDRLPLSLEEIKSADKKPRPKAGTPNLSTKRIPTKCFHLYFGLFIFLWIYLSPVMWLLVESSYKMAWFSPLHDWQLAFSVFFFSLQTLTKLSFSFPLSQFLISFYWWDQNLQEWTPSSLLAPKLSRKWKCPIIMASSQ